MLSPASLRVCCLAVMAPALTKADRRADCLPVVLSDPFCVSRTAASDNREDKLSEITFSKLSTKCASLNKRKPLPKAWIRTYVRSGTEFSDNKTRLSAVDLRKALLNSKVRFNVESKNKSWHGTNVTLAVAAKVRLKYTMNKNNSSLKNMGLAKANTSLGLHSMKRMNRITQLSHKDKTNPSDLSKDSGESSIELPDSSNSELETAFSIVRIVQPALEQSIEEVSSSCGNLINSSHSKRETLVSLSENVTLPVLSNATSISDVASDNCSFPLSPDVNISRDSVLPIALTHSECFSDKVKSPDVRCFQSDNTLTHRSNSFKILPPMSCSVTPSNSVDVGETNSKNDIHHQADAVLSATSSNIPMQNVSEVSDVNPQDSSVGNTNSFTSLPSSLCDVSVTEDGEVPLPFEAEASPPSSPLSLKDSEFEVASASSFTSSTLSADASPISSSLDEDGDTVFVTFPDSFLASDSWCPTQLATSSFSNISCPTPKSQFDSFRTVGVESDMHTTKNTCCPLEEQDISALKEMLIEREKRITIALNETEILLRKYMIEHVQKQIRTFVAHFQKKYTIPCQRPTKINSSKPPKDIVDLKAELLQSQDVKNMSTAALVSLVRKLESSTSSGNLLLPPSIAAQDTELLSKEAASVTISPEDYDDVKQKSRVLLTSMKSLLRSADPDLTESSDEGSSDIEVEDTVEDSIQKRALWKFMKERAALTSRSTWLIARIHELENQLRTVTGILKKVSSSVGDVCFEEQVVSESSVLSTAGSGGASLQTIKQNRPKGLGRPVNGYLDHGSINSPSVGHSNSSSEALQSERKLYIPSVVVDTGQSCSRTRALKTSTFHKRKLLITTGLHLTNIKLAKLSTIGCECNSQDEMMPCVLCTGRYNCVQSVDPDSLPLLDRVALLDPNFHPLLSFEKDIPMLVHFESILKKNEAQYQRVRPPSPTPNQRRLRFGTKPKHFSDARSRSRKLNRYARSLLSAKYRNKKHFRKHKLVFGKWRKLQNKSSFQARDRIRRLSVASSGSSHDSPVPSPGSAFDDGFGYDMKRKRDDNQFDIDDVIIPYSNKRGRLVKFEFKDIEIPSWRSKAFDNLESIDIEEDTADSTFIKRHEGYEVEERKIIRNGGGALCFFNTWQKRSSGVQPSDSRADSSGANTPDPVLIYDQDIMFQDPNSLLANSPLSPALSPPTTPSSVNLVSDDSQPASGLRIERKKTGGAKRTEEPVRINANDYVDIAPYEQRIFPLSDEIVEELLAESDHAKEDTDVTISGPSCPASPESSSSSVSTVEEDITDPEWTVVKRDSGSEQPLVLKFAKR